MKLRALKSMSTALASVLVMLFSNTASANLIMDPGFELGGSGWAAAGNGGFRNGISSGLGPNNGRWYADFNTNAPGGSVSQDLMLDAGSYELSFFLAQRGGGNDNTTLTVDLGAFIVSEDFLITSASGTWTQRSISFEVASATTATLKFEEFAASSNRGPGLDDVSLTRQAVPNPATLSLIGLGLVGLGYGRRKKT